MGILVLIAGSGDGLAGMNLGYIENTACKPRKHSEAGFINIFYVGLSKVSWVLKNYELILAGLVGFRKVISWV